VSQDLPTDLKAQRPACQNSARRRMPAETSGAAGFAAPNIEIIERSQLEKILKEQCLSLTGSSAMTRNR
jgi:hypothetical protein